MTRRDFLKSTAALSLAGIQTICGECFPGRRGFAQMRDAAERQLHWPTWRGPAFGGVGVNADPPIRWSESENVRWKIPLPGRGNGSPIVVGQCVYLITAFEDPDDDTRQTFALLALDRDSGRERWRRVLTEQTPREPGHPSNTYASSSPVTDGERLYVSLGSYGVYALDWQGNLLWQRRLGTMTTRRGYGEGSSPAVREGTLVVPFDHEGDSFLIALDAATGETRWRRSRDEPTTWATPLIAEHDGETQVVMSGQKQVTGYRLADGRTLWQCGPMTTNPIPSPIRHKQDVIVTTGYQGYVMHSIALAARGDVMDSASLNWTQREAAPYVSTPLLYRDQLYFVKSLTGLLVCCDANTGKLVWQFRLPKVSSVYASPIAASGRVYITGRNGTTVVLKAGATSEVIAVNRLDASIDASAALAGDSLFLRGKDVLYCLRQV